MADQRWNRPMNFYDVMSKASNSVGVKLRLGPRQYYGSMLRSIAERIRGVRGLEAGAIIPVDRPAATGAVEGLAELVWYEFNKPIWFVDNTMLELLKTAKIDDDLTGIHWPHESVFLCFEEGAKIDGFDLRSMLVFVPRSDHVIDIAKRAMGTDFFMAEFLGKLVGTWTDCLEGPEFELLPNGLIRTRNRLYNWRKYSEPAPRTDARGINDQEYEAMMKSMQIAAAAMLYYSARPELVQEYKLPRSQRYEFRGERSQFRKMVLPGVKKIRADHGELTAGTGSPKAPHYRGWVMRVLRDPRYKRKPDGTFQTVLVPPTAIHPELMENPDDEGIGDT